MAPLKEGLDRLAQAVKLADGTFGPDGRRMTAVDALIRETIDGDAGLAAKDAAANDAAADAWEAVARDLARQVIDAEAEMDAVIEAEEDETDSGAANYNAAEYWIKRCLVEEQAHCETYLEALRLTNELNGWQDSEAAEYRKSTAARRLDQYRESNTIAASPHPWQYGQKS